jgi:hypothetical protein
MPGNKIGMQVGLEDLADRSPVFPGRFQIDLNIALGVNHESSPSETSR